MHGINIHMSNILLLKYNRPTNFSFNKLLNHSNQFFDLNLEKFGSSIDLLKYSDIDAIFKDLQFDHVVVGDIFWPTGQNICKWCLNNNKKVYFLQHGQWIYTQNKKNPKYLPDVMFCYGSNLYNEISNWSGWNNCKIVVSGNPRYDDIISEIGDYVYFSPPVLVELNPSARSLIHQRTYNWIKSLKGLDGYCKLYIHPHYREGDIDFLRDIFPNSTFIDTNDDPLTWISKCKRVITHRNSTVVLDSIACMKNIDLINFYEFNNSIFPESYFGKFANENFSLTDIITSLQLHSNINYDFESTLRFIKLGKSCDRILSIINYGTLCDNDL